MKEITNVWTGYDEFGFGRTEKDTAMQWRIFYTFTKCMNSVYAYFKSTSAECILKLRHFSGFQARVALLMAQNICMVT